MRHWLRERSSRRRSDGGPLTGPDGDTVGRAIRPGQRPQGQSSSDSASQRVVRAARHRPTVTDTVDHLDPSVPGLQGALRTRLVRQAEPMITAVVREHLAASAPPGRGRADQRRRGAGSSSPSCSAATTRPRRPGSEARPPRAHSAGSAGPADEPVLLAPVIEGSLRLSTPRTCSTHRHHGHRVARRTDPRGERVMLNFASANLDPPPVRRPRGLPARPRRRRAPPSAPACTCAEASPSRGRSCAWHSPRCSPCRTWH